MEESVYDNKDTPRDSKDNIKIIGQTVRGSGIPPLLSPSSVNTNTGNGNNTGNSTIRDSDDTDDEDFAKSKMTGRYLSVSHLVQMFDFSFYVLFFVYCRLNMFTVSYI